MKLMPLPRGVTTTIRRAEKAQAMLRQPRRAPGRPKVLGHTHRLNIEIEAKYLERIDPPYSVWIREAIREKCEAETQRAINDLL